MNNSINGKSFSWLQSTKEKQLMGLKLGINCPVELTFKKVAKMPDEIFEN
jgi:hypothetical protein